MPRRKRAIRSPTFDQFSAEDDCFDDENGRHCGQPQQRNAANARERARMRVLSKAFCRLKTTLPWVPADTKLSKLDTLRLATSYIAHLRAALEDEPPEDSTTVHPLSLTWPFTFQNGNHSNSDGSPSLRCPDSDEWSPRRSPEDLHPQNNMVHHAGGSFHRSESQYCCDNVLMNIGG